MPESELPLFTHKNEGAQGENYSLGIEDDANQIRVALRAVGKEPTLNESTSFLRSQFYAVGSWRKPSRYQPHGPMTQQEADQVIAVVKQFLDKELKFDYNRIVSVQYATIVSYPQSETESFPIGFKLEPFPTNTQAIDQALSSLFPGRFKMGGSTSQRAAYIEAKYGAGQDMKPSSPLFYITLSCNLNMDMQGIQSEGPFAPGIRHKVINVDEVSELGAKFFPGVFKVTTRENPCEICGQINCLSQFASGHAIADIATKALGVQAQQAQLAQVAGRASLDKEAQICDVGGTSSSPGLDAYSVLQAAFQGNPVCRNIVRQAGIALGLITAETMAYTMRAPVVVIGGAVPMGMLQEISLPFGQRMGIDTTVQRVLNIHGYQDEIRVTRSRFAGFTGLLGVTE